MSISFFLFCNCENKPSRHPRVSDKILFTQRNSKTRCGFYTYRNIRWNKKVAFFNSHNYILKIKIWYWWVIMILPYITFNVPARLVWESNFQMNNEECTIIAIWYLSTISPFDSILLKTHSVQRKNVLNKGPEIKSPENRCLLRANAQEH